MGQKEVNPKPPAMDPISVALAMASCDVMVEHVARLNAALGLLQQKGLVSALEVQQALDSIAELPPEIVDEISNLLQAKMRARLAQRYQEIVLHSADEGPVQ